MSAKPGRGESGGKTGATASASAGPPEHRQGPDAAEAAGFGGITWADEAADGAAPGEGNGDGDAAAEPVPVEEEATDAGADAEISVEDLVRDLERVTAERDQYLDASRRIQAEFENYKKAVAKREAEARERANDSLVTEILPVLDACDGALASGTSEVEPVRAALMGALAKQGLARVDDVGSPFDPSRHDAVMHDPAEEGEDSDAPVVAEVMRAGYSWKGRVIRPAMVRVKG